MAILPTYGGVSTSIATPNTPNAPSNPFPGQLKRLGEATVEAGSEFGRVMQKRQNLDDEAMAMQQYMKASSEMSDVYDAYSTKPELGRNGKESFATFIEQKKADWYKGLTPGAAKRLDEHLINPTLEYRRRVSQLENRIHLEDYQGMNVKAKTDFQNFASTVEGDVDLKQTPQYQVYEKYLRTGEQNGYFKPHEVEQELQSALIGGVTSRVLKVANTTDPAEIETLLKDYTKEKLEPGSTSLKYLGADKVNSTERVLKERLEHLNNAAIAKKNQEYTDTQRMTADLSKSAENMADMKLREPQKYGRLTHDWIDLAQETKLFDAKEAGVWHNRINRQEMGGVQGEYGDPKLVARLWNEAHTVSEGPRARALQQEILQYQREGKLTAGPESESDKLLAHLQPIANSKEGGPPSLAAQMAEAKKQGIEGLTITSSFSSDKMRGAEKVVQQQMLRDQDVNAQNGYKLSPQEVLDKNMPRYKALLGTPAMEEQRLYQNELGIPQTRDTKASAQHVEAERVKARDMYKSAPPGPEGEAIREKALERVEKLRQLDLLNKAIEEFGAAKNASRAEALSGGGGSVPSKPTEQKKPGGPIKPPKGTF
jgi:hypothetical protein